MAEASTMFLTMKRLMALSLGTITPEASQRTRLTCREPPNRTSVRLYEHLSLRLALAAAWQSSMLGGCWTEIARTWPRPCFARPLFLLFFVMVATFCEKRAPAATVQRL
jgi:hypothetical protein